MRVLSILLWKHMKERWRTILHSTWEIVSGILVFVILLLVKQILVQDNETVEKFIHDIRAVDIVFAPKNKLSEQLMYGICSQSFDAHSNLHGENIHCFGYRNEDQVNDFISRNKFPNSETVIVIIFQNLNGEEFPKKLHYSIRFVRPDTYNITKFHSLYYPKDPSAIEKNATLFANMQWEIDKSYMKTLLREDIDHEVQFESVTELTSPETKEIHSFLALCTVLAPMPFFMTTHAALVDEKRSGIKALLKMYGVKPIVIHIAHLIDTAIFANIYAILIVILLFITASPILKYSNPIIIWFTFILHFLTITSLTFITSSLSQNLQHSDSLAVLFYLMTFLINLLWGGSKFGKSFGLTLIYIVLPHSPVFMFWNDVVASEAIREGALFKNIHRNHIPDDASSVLIVWVLFLVQLILILVLSWYLDLVRPGVYGVALPWHFIFSVYKDHGSVVTTVVDQVDLDVYKGEITVILGTSGAGKSALTSIVTGMCSATSGHVYVNGLDIETRLHDLRKDLAYCPERDLTFDYLTVKDNLIFFQYLRELTPREQLTETAEKINVDHMLKIFKMTDIANYYSKELSTGYRKCLQIACMLLCEAEVLVFDEPSTGMDAGMKHRLWDVLLTLRKEKTILMTSSCMQEADALGDRIALMSNGRVKCFASPSFLKNAIGADVVLSLRLSDADRLSNIEEEIHNIIQEAKIPEMHNTTVSKAERFRVSIHLPAQQRDHFPKVFDVLENKRHQLGIMSMNVGVSMEQVFLRFVDQDDDIDNVTQLQDFYSEVRLEGWRLTKHRLFWLIKRAWKHVWGFKYQYLFVQVLVPLIAFIVITLATNTSGYVKMFETGFKHGSTIILYQPLGRYRRTNDLYPMTLMFQNIAFRTSENVQKDIVRISSEQKQKLGKPTERILGIESGWRRTKIYYSLTSASDLPTAVNVFSNLYMSMTVPRSLGVSINMTIEPNPSVKKFVQPKNLYLCYCWSLWITFLVIIPLGPFIRLCIEELNNKVRFTHMLMGCSPSIIWLSKLLAHLAIYVAVVPWSIMIVAWTLDNDNTFNKLDFLGSMFLLLILFAPAHLLHWYVLSFRLSDKRPIAKMYIISLYLGLITPIFVFFLSEINHHWPVPLLVVLLILYTLANFVPAFTFAVGLSKISKVARNNAYCTLNYHLCPDNMVEDIWIPKDVCCDSDGSPFDYFSNFHTGLFELIFLILHSIFYFALLLMFQRRIIQWARDKFLKCSDVKPVVHSVHNVNVQTEEQYVKTKIDHFRTLNIKERQTDPDVLLAKELYKLYGRKRIHAVQGISFSVKKGECLAILGQTGAGKTTTLGMVAGFIVKTSGVTNVNGYFLRENQSEYLQSLAWCTERGLDEFLSGLQNLELLAALFGYPDRDAQRIAGRYLQYMGLTRYSHTPFRSYSPGCAHRLAVCSALISSSRAALLDELCANIDPYTRPLVTRAVQRLLAKNIAVVIAEGSLEWKQIDDCCNRIAIIDRGEIVAIGTVGEIRRDYASGYTVVIKLKVDITYQLVAEAHSSLTSLLSGKSMVQSRTVNDLKVEFLSLFQSSLLVDEHMSMLYFHIKDLYRTIEYSSMFQNLERLAKKYDVIEDYTLSETSIDEILCRISQQLHGDSEQKRTSLQIFTLEGA